jgi:inward rectifier potassium channel
MDKDIDNSGFGTSVNVKSTRFINKDGSHNVKHIGRPLSERNNIYSKLINIAWWKFLALVFVFYFFINLLFALIYYWFCLPNLLGMIRGSNWQNFQEAYFFSAQTLTTVGYGRISPNGFFTNTVAATEALIGILTLAINTGLLYGRFVKPKAHIKFSHNALIAPFRSGTALMLRLAPIKNASLSNMMVRVTASLMLPNENGKHINKFFNLPLQIETLDTFVTTWTVVHIIDNESPLWEMKPEQMEGTELEILVYVRAYDEDFSSTVVKRTSYTHEEIVHGAKFKPAFYEDPDGQGSIVEHQKLNQFELVDL